MINVYYYSLRLSGIASLLVSPPLIFALPSLLSIKSYKVELTMRAKHALALEAGRVWFTRLF